MNPDLFLDLCFHVYLDLATPLCSMRIILSTQCVGILCVFCLEDVDMFVCLFDVGSRHPAAKGSHNAEALAALQREAFARWGRSGTRQSC